MADAREFFENLVYRTVDRRRFTQQSPVMPDVWISYGLNPGEKLELLMVPNWHYTPADLAREIKAQLRQDAKAEITAALRAFRDDSGGAASVAHNQSVVAATLWFDELIRCVLPLSSWWRRSIARLDQARKRGSRGSEEDQLTRIIEAGEKAFVQGVTDVMRGTSSADVSRDVAWLTRVAGLIAYISHDSQRAEIARIEYEDEWTRYLARVDAEEHWPDHALALFQILDKVGSVYPSDDFPLYSVNRNRNTTSTVYESAAAVKADAAHRVFEVKGEGVRWAVVDSGIDARHIAFRKRDPDGTALDAPFLARASRRRARGRSRSTDMRTLNQTRIVATYEFTHVRELLGATPDEVDDLDRKKFPVLSKKEMRDRLRAYLTEHDEFVIDWERLEPFIRVPHADEYRPPHHPHGTHVAGILGADWRDGDDPPPPGGPRMTGVCPEIEIYDLRVLDEEGIGNEFAIMTALQFIRNLNNRKDFVAIHGANLSFSIEHDVANYACGRTPVCDEAERLVNSGLAVVAAAGNSGRARYLTPSNVIDDGFRTVSITDPGNADGVITVGATHRTDAHTYGVSYFSSRGPTGDGRLKPDLVAPGEKIRSTVPNDEDDTLDGTSMAAPHVSGAAALLIARHPEFIGQPRRIKTILCETATDLGRERYFQGAGLLDILRALQSV